MSYRSPYYGGGAPAPAASTDYDVYNPYGNAQEPHRAYDQAGYQYDADADAGGYRDEPFRPPANASAGNDYGAETPGASKERAYATKDEFVAPLPRRSGTKSASAVRSWRYDHQGNLWTKGGRGRCVGRFCCCSIMTFLFLLISILLCLALWIRPPNIVINGVAVNETGSAIQITKTGLTLNLDVNITVDNPNYFGVTFRKIQADITYPINNTAVGGGTSRNVHFGSRTNRDFDFPFSIVYVMADDPSNQILLDLAKKCGIIGGAQSDIVVNYKITLGLEIAFITISPVVSNQFSFKCPLSASDIEALLKEAGVDIGNL